MSHHYSGPDFGFPHGDARLDLTDLYAFPKPGEADKSILIMNVHPSAFVNPPGSTTREPFAPEALYELKIDTNGDAVADIAYRVRFSSSADGSQTATVRRVEGAQAAETSESGQVIIEGAPVSTGRDARVTEAGGYRFFAGWRSDPFFFDTRGALNDLRFTGDDFFIDKDVCSIVLEMPKSALGAKRVGIWARTLDGAGGVWVQADRGALPAQAVFLVGSERDGYHVSNRLQFRPPFRVPQLFRAMAVRSPTMPPTPSWPSSRTGRLPGTRSGPTSICSPSSRLWGRRTTSLCRATQLCLSHPNLAGRRGSWALHEGGRYEST
jgi:hypothetical protein